MAIVSEALTAATICKVHSGGLPCTVLAATTVQEVATKTFSVIVFVCLYSSSRSTGYEITLFC